MNLSLRTGETALPYPDDERYLVTNQGRVYSIRRKKFLKTPPNKQGYPRVNLGNKRHVCVHRLVAETFIPRDESLKLEVNHKDEDKANN